MWMLLLGILIGAVALIIVLSVALTVSVMRDIRTANARPDPALCYGHPFDPVAELKKQLSSPPTGFLWDLGVQFNEAGHPLLSLGLLDVATQKVTVSKHMNLYSMKGGETFADLYSGNRSLTERAIRAGITSQARWATLEANRAKGDLTERQELIG